METTIDQADGGVGMNCDDIHVGTYECAYNIQTPWRSDDGVAHFIAVDKCLLPEIIRLWEAGIRTTGCCCGHGDAETAFIGVRADFIPKMKEMGYKVFHNKYRPNDEDSFIPKTVLYYGDADKGYNWWDTEESPGFVEMEEQDNG